MTETSFEHQLPDAQNYFVLLHYLVLWSRDSWKSKSIPYIDWGNQLEDNVREVQLERLGKLAGSRVTWKTHPILVTCVHLHREDLKIQTFCMQVSDYSISITNLQTYNLKHNLGKQLAHRWLTWEQNPRCFIPSW